MFRNIFKIIKPIKNRYIRAAVIGSSVTLLFFLIDFLTKHYLYTSSLAEKNSQGGPLQTEWDIKILAGRSVLHQSTTFLDFLQISMPMWGSQLIAWLIACLLISIIISIKNKGVIIGLSITLAGVLGNTIDTIYNNGVRDIFFIPYADKGTFNLADTLIITGEIIAILWIAINWALTWIKNHKKIN